MFSIIDLKNSRGTNVLITRPYLAVGKNKGGKIKKYYYFYRLWTPQMFKRANLVGKIIQKCEDDRYIQYYRNRDIEVIPTDAAGLNLILKLYTSKGGEK